MLVMALTAQVVCSTSMKVGSWNPRNPCFKIVNKAVPVVIIANSLSQHLQISCILGSRAEFEEKEKKSECVTLTAVRRSVFTEFLTLSVRTLARILTRLQSMMAFRATFYDITNRM